MNKFYLFYAVLTICLLSCLKATTYRNSISDAASDVPDVKSIKILNSRTSYFVPLENYVHAVPKKTLVIILDKTDTDQGVLDHRDGQAHD